MSKNKKSRKPQPPRPHRDSLETVDEQDVSSGQPVQVATGSGSADDPETWDEGGGGATFEADSDLPPDVLRTMTLAWQGAIEPGTSPRTTVKGNLLDEIRAARDTQETWVEPGTEPVVGAGLATVAEADDPAATMPAALQPAVAAAKPEPTATPAAVDSVDQTYLSDEFAPPAREDDGQSTMPDTQAEARQRDTDDERTLELKSDQDDSIEKTHISDEFAPLSPEDKARDEGLRTEGDQPLDTGMQQAAADSEDSFEATLISDSHSGPEHIETMESGTRGIPARKTSPGPDDLPFVDDQTDLVIKVRAFRQQDGTGPADAEYHINRVLGEGGMGVVFDAVQTSINRSVAVKMMKKPKPSKKLDQYAASRHKFLAEAVVTGDLDHPNIVPIYDVGRDEKNALFYSMKNVVGTPWLDVIRSRSVHENLEVLMRVADAVAFAHARGVVHRDLKPENVMLGEFGEILLMDWGLAFPTQKFRKGESVRRTSSMGGTPAYMAPEMATGPIEKIGSWSDIYLLGAILYEIITGKPPHRGKNAMKCLMAAAKNHIEPTDKSGELIDIAMKAMATNPDDRYKTVQDFQAAVREYLSHTESITLSTRAEDDLLRARQTADYEDFQQAVFGFKESYELWKGNKRAVAGLGAARLAYAECALKKEDYDLGISQLDLSDPQHAALHGRLVAAKAERDARVQRIKTMKRVGLVAGLLFLVTAGSLTVWAMSERSRALVAESDALEQKGIAESEADRAMVAESDAKREAENARIAAAEAKRQESIAKGALEEAKRQEGIANTNAAQAIENLEIAKRNEAEAKRQEGIARTEKAAAEAARIDAERNARIAEERRIEAVAATRRAESEERRARYEAYIANIGLSAAKVDENAFDSARTILADIPKDQRNWEWGRLAHLCSQHDQTYDLGARIEAVALSPDGKRFVAGGWDGTASIFDQATGENLATIKHSEGIRILAVAFADDGRLIATGGDDRIVRLWQIDSDGGRHRELTAFQGHAGAVTSIDFSDDGRWLLTGSEDRSARIWDVGSGREIRRLRGHYDPVWAVAFAPGAKRIVTASQDGTARVWESKSGRWLPDEPGRNPAEQDVVVVNKPAQRSDVTGTAPAPFRGHQGPVFAAAISPKTGYVATAGFDRQILVWDPAGIENDRFANVSIDPGAEPVKASLDSAIQLRLEGHLRPVRSLRYSADGRFLVSGSDDNTVKIWELATGKAVKTFRGHDNPVRSCAFDPSGNWVLSGSYDRLVKKWSIHKYEEYRELASLRDLLGRAFDGHGQTPVLGATFSPDAQFIVTASQDRTAKKWDFLNSQKELETFKEGHEFLVSNAALVNKGGKLKLLTAAVDNSVRAWDVLTGAEEADLPGTGLSAALAVSPDGNWILTGSEQQTERSWTARLWRWTVDETTLRSQITEVRLAEPLRHVNEVTAVAFSPDGKLLVTGDGGGRCLLWRWDGTSARKVTELAIPSYGKAHNGKMTDAAFVKAGARMLLLSASSDGTVAIWDASSHDEIGTLKHHGGNDAAEPVLAVAVTPDGRTAVTTCEDRTVRIWDISNPESAREVRRLQPQGGAATLAANVERSMGQRWQPADLAARSDLTAREIDEFLRDAKLGRPFKPDEVERLKNGLFKALAGLSTIGVKDPDGLLRPRINSVSLSADGRRVLTANSEDGIVQIWDLATGRELVGQQLPVTVWSATFLPGRDGESDVLVVGGNGARLWNLDSGRERMSYTPNDEVASAAFSPDGRHIVTSSWDNSVRIWDARTGKSLARLIGHRREVRSAVFSRDGRHVLTASRDGAVKLWAVDLEQLTNPTDSPAGEHELRSVTWSYPADEAEAGEAWQAAFSPDGAHVIAGFDDGVARILNAETGALDAELKGHTGAVLCAAFSPDGRRALTGGDDLLALVWDVSVLKQPRPLKRLRGHTSAVTSVAFAPNNQRALTGSRDTTVKLWDVTPPQIQIAADEPIEAPRPGAAPELAEAAPSQEIVEDSEILTLSRHKGEVTSVQFSPDGRFVLSGSKDGTAIVWLALDWTKDLDVERLVAGAWRVRSTTQATLAAGQQ